MTLENLLLTLKEQPGSATFNDSIAVIDSEYSFTETAFQNGETNNDAGQNNGSCKLFAFARLHKLNEDQTLELFGDFYRIDVLQNPDGTDHANIRNFIKYGWKGIAFDGEALKSK